MIVLVRVFIAFKMLVLNLSLINAQLKVKYSNVKIGILLRAPE